MVLSDFSRLAFIEITHTLPGTYPLPLSIRSSVGACGSLTPRESRQLRGTPRHGQLSGSTPRSPEPIVNSTPLFRARALDTESSFMIRCRLGSSTIRERSRAACLALISLARGPVV